MRPGGTDCVRVCVCVFSGEPSTHSMNIIRALRLDSAVPRSDEEKNERFDLRCRIKMMAPVG